MVVAGAGVLGRSVAFAVASAHPPVRVVLAGDPAGAGASQAAGAMLGVLGEVTDHGVRTRHGRLRIELAVMAGKLWPSWRERVRAVAGPASPAQDGFGSGTFVILNAVSSRLDEASFAAVADAAAAHGLGCEQTDPAEVPGFRPLDNDRALRAWYLPDERFLDGRAWLDTLDAALTALPNVIRTGPGALSALTDGGYLLATPEGSFRAPQAVVAAGAWAGRLIEALDPELPVLPVVSAAGTAVTVAAPQPMPAVVRTPNRAYACGLHTVPQQDGSWYVGATAQPALSPAPAPTAGALRFLLEAALGQLDHQLATASLLRTHHGNRPLSLDGHPLIGPTLRAGLWVVSGTHRDGLHASPLIATALAEALLAPTGAADQLPGPLAAFPPCREPITDLTANEAAAQAANHHAALAAEARMRPPLTGNWPSQLSESYSNLMDRAYAAMPDGYVPPPDLAPLAYEKTGPALAELAAAHLQRCRRAGHSGRPPA
ncbi:hypothetical protein AV521_42640 [Streptomyces sp. IMTB 2501]|nr:hypothetical protein AV521_42640 [Streptomyces sp. IMTB 2501]